MQISSPAFENGGVVPQQYTCEGPNVSPPLQFSNLPENTKSLVLMVEDPDAPAKPWVHWLVYNISPTTTSFEAGKTPDDATEGICNGNTYGYEGPCPPTGIHIYDFKLYALDVVLDVPASANRQDILREIEGHVLEEALLQGKYELGKKNIN